VQSASGHLEMIQALALEAGAGTGTGAGAGAGGEVEPASHYVFLGGVLLVDWLESRADPLLDDAVLEMLSDAWCKSMSTKGTGVGAGTGAGVGAGTGTGSAGALTPLGDGSPCPPLGSKARSPSFLGA
jgi:hypothetical protein